MRRLICLALCALLVFLTGNMAVFAAQGGAGEEVYTKIEEYGNGFTYYNTVYQNPSYGREESHYVTVTGLDDEWAQISSWGREYYINRREYDAFVRLHSASLFSNILYIKRTD